MAFVNFATHEITAKIVYYGPGLGGKTTSLQYIHTNLSPDNRGKMISLATEEDRTIYFDFLPLHLGKIQDFAVRVQLYTVPGQVRYNATRKLVLRGADGVVFVADSQKHKKLSNMESFSNLEENLREHGKELKELPYVLQFNKIDLPNILQGGELNQILNKHKVPHFESCATIGLGVMEALKSVTKLVFNDLGKKALLQKRTRVPSAAIISSGSERVSVDAVPPTISKSGSSSNPGVYASEFTKETVVSVGNGPTPTDNAFKPTALQPDINSAVEADAPENVEESIDEIEDVEAITELEEEDDVSYSPFSINEPADRVSFSCGDMFEGNDKVKALVEAMEMQISRLQYREALGSAASVYRQILELFPHVTAGKESEPLLMLAINMKFKRFLRFKGLIESTSEPKIYDLLFAHHFLVDLYLSLKEI